MIEKRPIDRIRDSAINLKVGDRHAGAIQDLFNVGDKRLLSIHEHAIYEIKLPDNIDPERTNPKIAPMSQCVLSHGTSDPVVGRSFLQAKELFRPPYLPAGIDHIRGVELAFEAAQDLVAMRSIVEAVEEEIGAAEKSFLAGGTDPKRFVLPSIPELRTQAEAVVQRAKLVVGRMNDLAKLFYPEKAKRKNWPDVLAQEMIGKREEVVEEFERMWRQWVRALLFLSNTRNAIEHPDKVKWFAVEPFKMSPDGVVLPPIIEVVHPETPQPSTPAPLFLRGLFESTLTAFELLVIGLADATATPFAGIPVYVQELPEGHRRNKHVRYAYVSNWNGSVAVHG